MTIPDNQIALIIPVGIFKKKETDKRVLTRMITYISSKAFSKINTQTNIGTIRETKK